MEIKIKRIDKTIELPIYAKEFDAALDIRSAEEGTIEAGETKVFRTGLAFEIPKGYAGLVWDRGGLAANNSIHTMAGVLDSGYRGELKLVLKNLGKENFKIEKGMRIAQLIIQPIVNVLVKEVEELEKSEREAGHFGSTGLR